MESAFGIDHGYSEIEKWSFEGGLATVGRKIGGLTGKAGAGLQNSAAKKVTNPTGVAGAHGPMTKPTAAATSAKAVGGGKLNRLSTNMMKRPGLTGGLAVGGAGAAAAGGGAYAYNRRRQ